MTTSMTGSIEPLTPAQMEILAFERSWWKHLGRRDAVILERFGHSSIRHSQLVQHIITLPGAMAYDAQLTKRLIDRRDEARTRRSAR